MRKRPILALAAGLGLAGCSTPGPLHLYSIGPGATEVHDVALAPDMARDVPDFLAPGDQLTGFAYDPFTDHFFLRLAPGDHIRVVDRPARKIKLEFDITGAPATGGGDLAVNPRTGHLYLVNPAGPELIVSTRLGKYLGQITLQGRTRPAMAVAFDPARDQLVVLDPDHRTVERYAADGSFVGRIVLDQPVAASIAFDPVGNKLYAPLLDDADGVGVFDGTGHLVRTLTLRPGDRFIDVGPHSFLRIF
ncbi:MAG TPA: hypothetical protein VHE61_03380 [Opitutaceae bacterium]|nr:hypothetical protein [Opitutaceae bacterium]